MMKKLISLLLVLALMLPGAAMAQYGDNFQRDSHITVGSVSRLTGAFFTELWGNNTVDIDVRELLHGVSTVAWDANHQYVINENVVKLTKAEWTDAGKKFTFTVNYGLKWSDGYNITAKDFVFSILLQASPALAELGAEPTAYTWLAGYEDYHSGKTEPFAGVRLVNDRTFSLTVKPEYLPYFYEMVYLKVTPYPQHVIAPRNQPQDFGKGAFIYGDMTAEYLQEALLDPETGYRSHPSVVSGAYKLLSYDAVTGTAEFQANPYYPGDYLGQKPAIDRITFKEIQYNNALELLAAGEIDVINKATDGSFIAAGVEMAHAGEFQAVSYDRNGYGFLAFAGEEEQPVTGSLTVRQAMAMVMDRDAMIADFLQSYGRPVYSCYGLGLWVAQPYIDSMQDHVTVYAQDTEAAVKLLESDGWTLNAQGEAFTAGTDAVRYKKLDDGTLQPLAIKYAATKNNAAAAWIANHYAPALEAIGFQFETVDVTYDVLLSNYYRHTEREYNLMFLASNFNFVFDPYYMVHTSDAFQGVYNTSGVQDEELMELAGEMRETEAGDVEAYTKAWLAFEKRFSDVLPTLPIYTNIYHDFCSNRIKGYAPDAHITWTQAILYAEVAE